MADEIKQVLGFDASQAIDTLRQLDQAMATLESRLQSSASQFGGFNKNAGRTVSALIQLATNADKAAKALAAVGGLPAARNVAADATAAASAVGSAVAALDQAGAASRNASVRVGDAMIRISRESKTAAAEVTSATNRMTTSLALLSRIVFTQAVIRALSQLRNAFRATVNDAIAFQRSLALITTIDDSGRSLGQLSDSVRGISDQFNIPLLQTAAGLYQTISNQVGNTAQSLEFLGDAAKFARSTNSTLSDSVDLLSGALKSFNLGVEDTDRVSSVFFKTIDLGRITADQLSNAFGRVGPAAGQLGVEIEELGAAVAAISVRGSNTAETLTQFRNILTALVKPSDAMKKALRELNFESAESAIKTLGLDGVLRELAKSTSGSAEAMARLFPNVRGLNGVAALTSDNLETLASNIEEMRSAGEKFTDSKFLQATQTDAEKVTEQINKLKNAFTVDLGQALLKAIADFSTLTGGVDNFTGIIQSAGPAILGFAASVATLGAALKTAQIAGVGLNKALGALALVPLAIGAGESIGNFIDTKLFDKNFADLKALQDKQAADLKTFSEKLEAEADKQVAADKERVKAIRQGTLEITGQYLTQRDVAISANASLVKSTKASVNDILRAFDLLADAERDAAANARSVQQQSADRVTNLQDRLRDLDFEGQTRSFDEAQKVFLLNKRSADLASDASRTLAQAGGDQDKINRGLALFQQSQRAAEQAQSLAERTGDAGLEGRARQQLKSAIDEQISAERRLGQLQGQRVTALNREREATKGIVDQIREQSKLVTDNTGIFDADGQQFSGAEQKKRADQRADALKRLIDLSKQIDPSKLRSLGLTDFINQFEQQLTRDPIRLAFTVENETERIKKQLDDAFGQFKFNLNVGANVDVARLEAVLGKTAGSLTTPDQVFAGLDEAVAKANEIRQTINDSITGDALQQNLRGEIDNIFAKIQQLQGARETFSSDVAESARTSFDAVATLLTEISNKSQITKGDIDAAGNAVKSFNEAIRGGGVNERLAFNSSSDALDLLLQKLISIQQQQQQQSQSPQVQQLQQQLQSLDAVQQRIQQSGLTGQLQAGGQALSTGATALSNAVQPATVINSQAQSAGQALANGAAAWLQASQATFAPPGAVATNAANGLIKAFAKGGYMRYFANGGLAARGVDTIPVMAQEGESIITAKSTRRFFSQIQAMNAGLNPVFRQDGGSVTNVGDTYISVNGAGSPRAVGNEVFRIINRSQRRGSGRIKKK